jgi:ribonucleoside-diphosphate reductase alpha chain
VGQLPGQKGAEQHGEDDDSSDETPVATKADGRIAGQGAVASVGNNPVASKPSTNGGGSHAKPAGLNGNHGASAKTSTNGASTNGTANGAKRFDVKHVDMDSLERAGVAMKSGSARSDQFAKFQLDAPSCDNCGSITVRNGNCYLCHNCGNSMGCS